jgi:hypothetical protein
MAEKIRKKTLLQHLGSPESAEEMITLLEKLNNDLEIKYVDFDLTSKKGLTVTDENKVRVYGVKGDPESIIENTFSKVGTGGNRLETKDPYTVASTVTGQTTHNQMENAIQKLIHTKYKGKVLSNKPVFAHADNPQLPRAVIEKLENIADGIIKNAIKKQEAIDPNQKAIIATEQILLKDERTAGTGDVIVFYSKKNAKGKIEFSHDIKDFKTVRVGAKSLSSFTDEFGVRRIENFDFFKPTAFKDWSLQLGRASKALKNFKSTEDSLEIIPIRIEHDRNDKNKIASVYTSQDDNRFLKSILLKLPKAKGTELFNKELEKLQQLIVNTELELKDSSLSQNKRSRLHHELSRASRSLKALLIEQDTGRLVQEYQNLLSDIATLAEGTNLVSDVRKSDSLLVGDYLEYFKNVQVYKDTLNTAEAYYASIGVQPSTENVEARSLMSRNLAILEVKLKEEIISLLTGKHGDAILSTSSTDDLNWIAQNTTVFSEMQNPITQAAYQEISKQSHKSEHLSIEFENEVRGEVKDLEEWAGNRGMSIYKVYEKYFVNRATGNLYSKFNKELKEYVDAAFLNTDLTARAKSLGQIYTKRADADEIYKKRYNAYLEYTGYKTDNAEQFKKIKDWVSKNSVASALQNRSLLHMYYELDAAQAKRFYSEEYKTIDSIPELKKFYEFWEKSMRKARLNYGMEFDFSQIPDNYVPWFRGEVIDSIFDGNMPKVAWNNLVDYFTYQEDNFEYGDIESGVRRDLNDGSVLHGIPKLGLRRIKNTQGKVDADLKSYDLGKTLASFMASSIRYDSMNRIEGEIDSLLFLQGTFGVKPGDSAAQGTDTGTYKALKTAINRHMRGIHMEVPASQRGLYKTITAVNSTGIQAALGAKYVTQVAAGLTSKLNARVKAAGGYFYTSNQLWDAEKTMVTVATSKSKESNKVKGLMAFFNVMDKSLKLRTADIGGSVLNIRNLSKLELAFTGFRKLGKEWVIGTQFLAMMHNYAIKDGKLTRIGKKTDLTSIYDSITEKNGNMVIPGLVDSKGEVNYDLYNDIKNLTDHVFRRTTGEMSSTNRNNLEANLVYKLLGTYKSWLPALAAENFAGVRYMKEIDALTIGRQSSLWYNDLKPTKALEGIKNSKDLPNISKNILFMMGHLAGELLKVSLDVATFGYAKNMPFYHKVNQERALGLYNDFLAKNPDNPEIQNMSFEDFQDYMHGQIRSAITEIRVISGLLLSVLVAGKADLDDNGEPDWKQYLFTRQLFRILNRVRREALFFYSDEYIKLAAQGSLPILGYGLLAIDALTNTIQESHDAIYNIDNKRDRTPWYHYWVKGVPYNGYITTFDPFEGDEKREF